MAENSKIEWTDHTFNPWIGCQRVSPGCVHCYAETRDNRFTGGANWGPRGTRTVTSEGNWRRPLKWNRDAEIAGRRARVFCASLADVFEDRPDLVAPRARLFALIQATPWLDWLLLTKRPENMVRLAVTSGWEGAWPENVWAGCTAEDQQRADERIPHLLSVPAAVRFLSCEPLLGPVDLQEINPYGPGDKFNALRGSRTSYFSKPRNPGECAIGVSVVPGPRIHWVICGGESGHGARPMHPDWARSLRDQCAAAGVAFHFKQWGEWAVGDNGFPRNVIVEPDGRVVPGPEGEGYAGLRGPRWVVMHRFGKAAAGRLLDGREHNEFPRLAETAEVG